MQATIYLEIKDAYEVLKDKKKRQDYDLVLTNTFNSHRTYGKYSEAPCQSFKKRDSSNVGFCIVCISNFFLPFMRQ